MRILVVCAAAVALSGCASVTRGWNEQVNFDSVPSGAEVRIAVENACPAGGCTVADNSGNASAAAEAPPPDQPKPNLGCVTPCQLEVRRNDVLLATYTKPGYQPQTIRVDTRVAGTGALGMAGNVLIGGVVGLAVDAASGASLEHYPNPAVAQLQAVPAPRPVAPPVRRKPPQRPVSRRRRSGRRCAENGTAARLRTDHSAPAGIIRRRLRAGG